MNTQNCFTDIWHVISRGNDGRQVFHERADYEHYLELMGLYLPEFKCELCHYALIPNHTHNVIGAESIESISGLMKKLNWTYSRDYKRKYGGDGHLWRNRFKRYLIDNDSYLQTCGAYVELNPVRAGLVEQPEDYAWSSCRAYLFDEQNPLIKHDPVFLGLNDDPKIRAEEYRKLLNMWQEYPVTKNVAKKFFRQGADQRHPIIK